MAGRKIAIASLVLTGLATIFAAVQIVPIVFPQRIAPTPTPVPALSEEGRSAGTLLPPPQAVNSGPSRKTFPLVSGSIGDYSDLVRFKSEINLHAEKIVKLKLSIDFGIASHDTFENDDGSSFKRLIISVANECDLDDSGVKVPNHACGGSEYVVVFEKGGRLYVANGSDIVEGYFSVEPQQGMHQGWVSTGLVAVPDADARIAEQ